ncbi:MAG: site-specific DNA-methyltransferase [Bacteroidetes bacterium]|nr:site-specific DNA-methyltransferase [Bacteroidota bacterium]MCL5027358.1 site-specific DNA-methyltransferase [Chloroflexota bacterium]
MTELIWDGKYDEDGRRVAPLRVALPFQTVETVNESAQERQRTLDLFSAGRDPEWRNRLIWGDKKYVLPSLLPEFAGKVDLIYIDPPFDTGADFSFQVRVDGEGFTKEPSVIEQKAYRDTWGQGLDSYLRWFSEAAMLLRELLADSGSIYVHLDYHVGHYGKVVLDEVFGTDNYRNEIVVKRRITKNLQRQFEAIQALSCAHDTVLWYSKNSQTRYRPLYFSMEPKSSQGYWHHFWSNADRPTMRYELLGITPKTGQWKWSKERALRAVENYQKYLQQGNGRTLAQYWADTGQTLEFIRPSDTGKVENWFPPASERMADTLWVDIHAYENVKDYATQKHSDLLERITKASSNENDLVLDCFCGSGTTAVVAEKLNRRWIAADLGRFAIHTTRKRLLSIPNVRPFVVQNLGRYERQLWQAAEFGEQAEVRAVAYRHFILDLYKARPITGYAWLHGLKNGRMVHIGTVDAPVSPGDVAQIAAEFRRAVGSGADAPRSNAVDVLGWDFAFEMNEVARQQAALANIDLRFVRIPREVLEKRAVEQGDIRFFELAALSVNVDQTGRAVTLTLTDFVIPLDDVPEDVQRAITNWAQWIDYWAVDWDNKGDAFHNQWQTYRTRKSRDLQKSVSHTYDEPGVYKIVVKVIDILGNDTTKTLKVEVP